MKQIFNIFTVIVLCSFLLSNTTIQIKDCKWKNIELKKIYRQKEQAFIDLLNNVRINRVTNNDMNLLHSRYNPTFTPEKESAYITLATHNRKVDEINHTQLMALPAKEAIFHAEVTGIEPTLEQIHALCKAELLNKKQVKIGFFKE